MTDDRDTPADLIEWARLATSRMTREQLRAELALTEWARVAGSRDELVRLAYAAGVRKSRIHALTGIARTSIDRILGRLDTDGR